MNWTLVHLIQHFNSHSDQTVYSGRPRRRKYRILSPGAGIRWIFFVVSAVPHMDFSLALNLISEDYEKTCLWHFGKLLNSGTGSHCSCLELRRRHCPPQFFSNHHVTCICPLLLLNVLLDSSIFLLVSINSHLL